LASIKDLTLLPNIGHALIKKLQDVGITSIEELKAVGSKKAINKIAILQNGRACINMLYAVEGAIQGVRWYGLSKERKDELKEFFRMMESSKNQD